MLGRTKIQYRFLIVRLRVIAIWERGRRRCFVFGLQFQRSLRVAGSCRVQPCCLQRVWRSRACLFVCCLVDLFVCPLACLFVSFFFCVCVCVCVSECCCFICSGLGSKLVVHAFPMQCSHQVSKTSSPSAQNLDPSV